MRAGSGTKVRYLKRSVRWRGVLLSACLPYLLLSLFLAFVHVERIDGDVPHAIHGSIAHVAAPSLHSERIPTDSCAACSWLRVQTSQQVQVSVGVWTPLDLDNPLPLDAALPDNPMPRTSPGRGPPLSL